MAPKHKKNKDDFEIPNKHRIKLQKIDRKDHLRHKSSLPRNLVESPQNSDDEQYHQKLYILMQDRLNRGSEWWRKVNYRFFRQISQDEVKVLEEKTSGSHLLQLKYPARQVQNYINEQFYPSNPFLSSPALLRVLFRHEIKLQRIEHNEVVTFAFKQYEQPENVPAEKLDPNLHISSFHVPPQTSAIYPPQLNCLDLDIIDVERNQEQILKMLRYDVTDLENEDITRQILLWEKELDNIDSRNKKNWANMILRREQKLQQLPPQQDIFTNQISEIKKELRMNEVRLYFKRGHGDKTDQMLEQALEIATIREMSLKEQQRKKRNTKMEQLKNLFETDCKICFCTQSDDKNRVVYCDSCNTSFHQACYGLEQLGDGKYYCEVCQFLRNSTVHDKTTGTTRVYKKPICLICCKLNFPMRQLRGHFYHVTCLVLFNLVEIKDYQLEFKRHLTHQSLVEIVVDNELQSGHCKYCLKDTGMKFACSIQGCPHYFHPICGYLNGVNFQLKRSFRSVSPKLTCPQHHEPQRNSLNQIYLRRFFCDYNGTSKLTDIDFQTVYKEEQAKRAANTQTKHNEMKNIILKKGKLLKNHKAMPPKVRKPPRQRSQGALSKKESESVQNSGVMVQNDVTQTRKLLKNLQGTRHKLS